MKQPITMTCRRCKGVGCKDCQHRGWIFIPLPYHGGQIEIVRS
jgi:hypothetical protein